MKDRTFGLAVIFLTIYLPKSQGADACSYGDVRLVGPGSTPSQGTVEVCYDNQWGTVCDYLWGTDDATVVCNQLGYNGTSSAYSSAYFGEGNGTVLLNGLTCTGAEGSLLECSFYYSIGATGCDHSTDAGVNCTSDLPVNCVDGAVRLTGNSTNSEGTVEVCYNNQWGTICDDSWDTSDAAVVCKQLGYYGPSSAYFGAYFGQGSGDILLGGLACTGSEDTLLQCSYTFSIGSTGCYHANDAGVSCSSAELTNCTTGDVRLVGPGSTPSQGRVEVCYDNQWGTVCNYNWNAKAAAVVCKQLGHYGPSVAQTNAYFGQGVGPILLGSVTCSGLETSLLSCARNGGSIGSTGCSHSQDASVICSESDACTTMGDVRLVGGGSPTHASEGTVEVCYNNQWGTICDDSWDASDAAVVCKQLGYYGTSTAYSNTTRQTSPAVLGGVACTGAETSLLSCVRNNTINPTGCSPAGVQCSLSDVCNTTGDVRLVGPGSTPSQGRVEVCYDNQWGTVCNYNWNANDAIVVCRQLGYNGASLAYGNAQFGLGTGPIYLSGLFCTGSEGSLLECSRYLSMGATGCHHSQDAGVHCSLDMTQGCTTGAVRLAAGNSTEGRVELCYGNQWGTVCDYLWDLNEANMVCKQLGYSGPSVAYSAAYFGLGTGPIFLAGVTCTGTEQSLLECARYYGIGMSPCSHNQDVGVACTIGQTYSCTTGDVRLVGPASTPSQGRVEVCYDNQWGTVCDYIWSSINAAVVCKQLGYNGTSIAYSGAFFGMGTGPVLLSGLFCSGSETAILECPRYYSIGATPCSHLQDASVACTMA